MNIYNKREKRRGQNDRRASRHNPHLGYMIDAGAITAATGTRRTKANPSLLVTGQENAVFAFCPQCKVTVELIEEQNKYNPHKTVKKCPHCKLIHKSPIWEGLLST